MISALIGLVLLQAPPGKELFEKRCAGCHTVDTDRVGPKMRGVYGRRIGSVEGFPYSDALKTSQSTWNDEMLNKWLADPDQFAPGNDMAFRVSKPEERTAIIEFLKTLSVNGSKR